MEIVHRLQQGDRPSIGTGHGIGTGTGEGAGTHSGTGEGAGTHSGTGTGASVGAQGMDYHLMTNGLVMFRDKIYVPYNNELKKVILREFHEKPYSGHPGYQKTLTAVKRSYY